MTHSLLLFAPSIFPSFSPDPADAPCAPLWDSDKCCFAGLMTASDVVDIMRVFHTPGTGAPASAALSELTIAGWRAYASSIEGLKRGLSSPDFARLVAEEDERAAGGGGGAGAGAGAASGAGADAVGAPSDEMMEVGHGGGGGPTVAASSSSSSSSSSAMGGALSPEEAASRRARRRGRRLHRRLISVDPEDSLLTVSEKMRRYRIHHMPVLDVDQSSVVAVLSHRALLHHILARFSDSRRLFYQPLYSLGVGSFGDVVVVPEAASVISVLNVLAERRISSVPIVNAGGQVVDVYSRDDVAFLANDPTLNVLDAPVGEVRRAQIQMMGPSTPLVTCHRYDTLHRCLELFAATDGRCERLICVDEHNRCTGIVSLSDIFAYLGSEGRIGPKGMGEGGGEGAEGRDGERGGDNGSGMGAGGGGGGGGGGGPGGDGTSSGSPIVGLPLAA
jgi:CBS domain-containing protein